MMFRQLVVVSRRSLCYAVIVLRDMLSIMLCIITDMANI